MTYDELHTSTVVEDLNIGWSYDVRCYYPLICPKGTKVKFRSVVHNYYGTWAEVEYEGEVKYCFLSHLDRYIKDVKRLDGFDIVSCTYNPTFIYTLSTGETYSVSEKQPRLRRL